MKINIINAGGFKSYSLNQMCVLFSLLHTCALAQDEGDNTGVWRTGTVHCAGSATSQICFRLPISNPNPNP